MDEIIKRYLKAKKIDHVRFVDISNLKYSMNRGFSKAIIFYIPFRKDYIVRLRDNKLFNKQEFNDLERQTDSTADSLAKLIIKKGYNAFSQSEQSLEKDGVFNAAKLSTPLPAKTIGLLAGLGWIGKNDLLITKEYGCAISMCTVITNAPLITKKYNMCKSFCGECNECIKVCELRLITGQSWNMHTGRDSLINVHECASCLKCLAFCPWSHKYSCRK